MSPDSRYPPVFIVSTGRCGSTLMSRLVNMHPRMLSLSEFFMSLASRAFVPRSLDGKDFWHMLSRSAKGERLVFNPDELREEFLYPWHPGSAFTPGNLPPLLFVALPHLTDEPDALYFELEPVIRSRPRLPLAQQYGFLFDWLRRRLGKDLWIERSGASLIFLPALKRLFPDALYVHIYRDGRDVAMSMQNHSPTRLFAHTWLAARRFGINPLRPPFLMGASRTLSTLEPLAVRLFGLERKLREPLSPETLGRFWNELVEIGLESLSDIPEGRLLNIRYEDLVARPRETLAEFAAFPGPDLVDNDWLDSASLIPAVRPAAWLDLPQAQRAGLNDACRPGLEALGYTDPS